jgi:hypothetical protein
MSREKAIARAAKQFDDGTFFDLLAGWVHHPTESQNEACHEALKTYLTGAITPYLESMGFTCRLAENPVDPRLPFLIGQRMEAEDFPTVLIYGHGDTVLAMDGRWREGLEPWRMIRDGDRWYGRGAADNKGQHAVNLAALACVLEEKKQLGFNVKVLIEMGEEMGSPGLHKICAIEKQALAADVLIASDGPRIDPQKPTLFGGSRAVFNFDLRLNLREGGHHSGNWGGLLANPGIILAHAIACLVDARGKIMVDGLRPEGIPESVKRALAELEVTGREGPEIDPGWAIPDSAWPRKFTAGIAWKCWPLSAATRPLRCTPFRPVPGPACICASWPAAIRTNSSPPFENIWTRAVFQRLRSCRPAKPGIRQPAWTRTIPGPNGQFHHWKEPAGKDRLFCPTWAEPCPTMPSAKCWGCPPSGCPTHTAAARSTRPTNICWRRSPGRGCK